MLAALSIRATISLVIAGIADHLSTFNSARLSDYNSHATPVGKASVEIERFCPYTDLVKCTKEGVLLSFGCCMTRGENHTLFLTECPYFELKGHKNIIVEDILFIGYIRLPNNISELNDYMCGPMNRKGLLCKDCIDGFGPSVTSLGYKCSNCTDAWYGIPLYLAVELIPITLFYLIILIFKVHLTSAPMTLFIFYNQLIMYMTLFLQSTSPSRQSWHKTVAALFSTVLYFFLGFGA